MFYEKKTETIICLAFAILLGLGACGGSGQQNFYTVAVVNNTDAPITVRYDRDEIFWISQWFGEVTIQPNAGQIIEWNSDTWGSERIEVEYQGKKKLFVVGPVDTVQVFVQDFP